MEKMDKLLIFPGPEVFWKKAILIKIFISETT